MKISSHDDETHVAKRSIRLWDDDHDAACRVYPCGGHTKEGIAPVDDTVYMHRNLAGLVPEIRSEIFRTTARFPIHECGYPMTLIYDYWRDGEFGCIGARFVCERWACQ